MAWIRTVVVYRRTELCNLSLREHTERLLQELVYVLTAVFLQLVSACFKKNPSLTTTDNLLAGKAFSDLLASWQLPIV